jgi:TPR repeat protein
MVAETSALYSQIPRELDEISRNAMLAAPGLAALFEEQGNDDEAERWYRKAAEAGNTTAMVNLGVLVVRQGNDDEAERCYRKAAEADEQTHRDQPG